MDLRGKKEITAADFIVLLRERIDSIRRDLNESDKVLIHAQSASFILGQLEKSINLSEGTSHE